MVVGETVVVGVVGTWVVVVVVVAAGVAVVVACAIEVVDTDWVLIPAGTFTTI